MRSPRYLKHLVFSLLAATLRAQNLPQTQPSPQAALIEQSNDALAKGDYATAETLLTNLNARVPNDPHILFNLGFAEEALGHTSEAEADYRKAMAADPSFADAHAALGLVLARGGHSAEAHTELALAASLAAEPALQGRALRALARLDQNAKPQAAANELIAALKITPETPDDILLAAELAESAGDLPGSEQAYKRHLAITPQDPAGTAALAHVLLREQHLAEAESVLTAALAGRPGDPALTAQLASVYLASGDDDRIAQAIPLVEALHAAHADDPSITRLLARLYVETGHSDLAEPLYATLLAAHPEHPDPTLLDDRAEALLRLHRPGEAERLLKLAVADPAAFPTPAGLGDAATHLAFAAAEIDDPRMVLQALALRATVLQPSPSTLYLEATANDTLHRSSQAANLYRKFLAAADGKYPEEESQARKRLALLEHSK